MSVLFGGDGDFDGRHWQDVARRVRMSLQRTQGPLDPSVAEAADQLSLIGWGKLFLPHHFTLPTSAMHDWLDEMLGRPSTSRGWKLNVIGPRGAAKSTLVTLAYVLRMAVEAREPYIWIVSDTRHQAISHLDNVKSELVENELLAGAYPAAVGKGPVWRAGTIVLSNRTALEAFGTRQRIRGRRRRAHRPTLIVCDDLQNDSHIESARARELSRRWFHGTLMKAGTRRTNIINLATALHREAIALELNETPGWTSRVFRAIQTWPANMLPWQQWEAIYCNLDGPDSKSAARAFYDLHRAAMDEGAVVLWPAEEDLYTLMCMRVESGRTAFEREKQGSPINPEMCEWPEEYFDEQSWFECWPASLRIKVLTLDPSKGQDARRGDYSAFVMLGVDRRGLLFVEADLARRPTPQIVADGVELFRRFKPDAFGVEANQFQDLLVDDFAAEFARQGVVGARPWAIDNRVNKLVRIRRIGPFLSQRKLRFKTQSPSTRLLVEQLRSFPAGDCDDGPDALEMAIRLAQDLADGTPDDGLGDRLVGQ